MNPPATKAKPWTRGKWTAVISLLFAAHVLIALRFTSSAKLEARPGSPQMTWLMLSTPAEHSRWGEALALHDPALFAHGNAWSFSGEAWLNQTAAPHRLTDWTNPPFWLSLTTNGLGVAFRTYLQTNLPSFANVAAASEPPVFKLPALASLLETQSLLTVEGDFALWQPRLREPLPVIAQTEFITNSVVEILADARGRLLSHTLLSSSGSHLADGLALERARTMRWEPPPTNSNSPWPKNRRMSGKLVFHWLAAPATDSAAASAPGSGS